MDQTDKTTGTTTGTTTDTTDMTDKTTNTAMDAFNEQIASEVFCAGYNTKIPATEDCPTDCRYCPQTDRRLLFGGVPLPKPAQKKCCAAHIPLMMG